MTYGDGCADGAGVPTLASDPVVDTDADLRPTPSESISIARPEDTVVSEPPPAPNYPLYRVEPGSRIILSEFDPEESEHYTRKKDVQEELHIQRDRIRELQARLYAENQRSVLIVLQALDTGGKDGTIRGVFQGVNP